MFQLVVSDNQLISIKWIVLCRLYKTHLDREYKRIHPDMFWKTAVTRGVFRSL